MLTSQQRPKSRMTDDLDPEHLGQLALVPPGRRQERGQARQGVTVPDPRDQSDGPLARPLGVDEARHDLDGQPVEPVAPEHVHHAIMEVFKRRQGRSTEDLRPALRRQLVTAFERSGLSPSDYLALVQGRDESANQLVQEALHDAEAQSARRQALQRAYEASGKPVDEFAQMYGMDVREVRRVLSIQ